MNMWRTITAAILVLVIAGCSTQRTAVRSFISEEGAQQADMLLEDAMFLLCRGATIGSINRRFADNAEKAAAYRELCAQDETGVILESE